MQTKQDLLTMRAEILADQQALSNIPTQFQDADLSALLRQGLTHHLTLVDAALDTLEFPEPTHTPSR